MAKEYENANDCYSLDHIDRTDEIVMVRWQVNHYHNELHSVGIGNTTPVEAARYALDVFPKATILAIWEVSIGGRLIAQVPAEEYNGQALLRLSMKKVLNSRNG